jgi:hypothetical protein
LAFGSFSNELSNTLLHFGQIYDGPAYKDKKVRKDEWEKIYESRIAVTTTELIAATKEKKYKTYTSQNMLHTYIYPLMNQDLLTIYKVS